MKSKDQKRREANERNSKWAAMSSKDQLKYLDDNKLSAAKQRKKIAAHMAKSETTTNDSVKTKKSNSGLRGRRKK